MLTRMFAYLTLAAYLVVGTVAVRIFAPEMSTVSFTTSYAKIFSQSEIKTALVESLKTPEIAFTEITFPVERKVVVVKAAPVVSKKAVVVNKTAEFKFERVAKNELPFNEPVKLEAIRSSIEMNQVASLYREFRFERLAAADMIEDVVSTGQASTEDGEPEFFEYPTETAEVKSEEKTENEISLAQDVINNVEKSSAVDNSSEEVAVDDLIAFDYSKAVQDVKNQTIPTVGKMTTQISGGAPVSPALSNPSTTPSTASSHLAIKAVDNSVPTHTEKEKRGAVDNSKKIVRPNDYSSSVTIQISGTNLEKSQEEVGFEVRFLDDLTEMIQDHNTGYATLNSKITHENMNRSLTVLKRGYAPTNTDLIVSAGDTTVSLPMIEEATFNELLAPYEARGAIGAVLVELDDKVSGASLDVPYSQVLHLNEDMKVTTADDFTYQLFVGVKAGNALLSYKDGNGKAASKIIHIHERELTFEAFYAEEVTSESISLLEENLLSKEKSPLIISTEEVKEFVTGRSTNKVNDHTFETDYRQTLLGGRKYLELTHLNEPVFIGYKNASKALVPSESFIRHVLSKFEGSSLGNRCVVQVNLSKQAISVDVAAESLDSSIMTSTQVLDTDGKFYESVGPKSKKVIIVGENQGSVENMEGKINVKVTYQDGSVEYLGSYCSPNTYLVEQL